jgi:enamine deaminase RidA (YjgF/YER057c/UK114 family)
MAKRMRITSPKVAEPPPQRWSNCIRVGDMVWVAGMTARMGDNVGGADEYEQSKTIFTKIKDLVEAAGGKMNDVVKVTIFVTDITQREQVWRARREFFTGNFPASTLVEVAALAEPALKVEIEAIAHIGAGRR